jgi:hypothetical protein
MAKQKKFDVVAAVKDAARFHIGQPKPSEIIVPRKDKPLRYKKNWLKNPDQEED